VSARRELALREIIGKRVECVVEDSIFEGRTGVVEAHRERPEGFTVVRDDGHGKMFLRADEMRLLP
jgi:hypothetical protein